MADGGVVTAFLVGLGFSVSGEEKFTGAIARSKTAAAGASSAIEGVAKAVTHSRLAAVEASAALLGMVAVIAKVSQSYEALFYSSQRTYASVGSIQALGYALSQVGGSAAGANEALEHIGSFLRTSPSAEGFFASMGVQTRNLKGQLLDTTEILANFGKAARGMDYRVALFRAGALGIDERTLQALMRDSGDFSRQLKRMYAEAGIDSQQAAQGSAQFMQVLRSFGATVQVLRDKVAINLQRGVGGDIERLRRLIEGNFGRISEIITVATGFVLKLGEAFLHLGGRTFEVLDNLYDHFERMDPSSKRWIEAAGGIVLAWRLMNTAFAQSPIGRLILLGSAIMLLYDDYKTFKEGGKSLIDWKAWQSDINLALDAIHTLKTDLMNVWSDVSPYLSPLATFFKREFLDALRTAFVAFDGFLKAVDDSLHGRWSAALGDLKKVWGAVNDSGKEGQGAAGQLATEENDVSGGAISQAASEAYQAARRTTRSLTGQVVRDEATAVQTITQGGYTREQAIGLTANLQGESGLDAKARGDYDKQGNATAFGIAQWHMDRVKRIQAETGIDVRTASYADQLKAVMHELSATGQERAAGQDLKTQGSHTDAAASVTRLYERPADVGKDTATRWGIADAIAERIHRGDRTPPAADPTMLVLHREPPAGPVSNVSNATHNETHNSTQQTGVDSHDQTHVSMADSHDQSHSATADSHDIVHRNAPVDNRNYSQDTHHTETYFEQHPFGANPAPVKPAPPPLLSVHHDIEVSAAAAVAHDANRINTPLVIPAPAETKVHAPQITQTNEITIQYSRDPHKDAEALQRALDGHGAAIVRNMGPRSG